MIRNPVCPACGDSDCTAKVSALFLEGIQAGQKASARRSKVSTQAEVSLPAIFRNLPASRLKLLSQRLKPPESGTSSTFRPVSPDLVVIAFSLFAPFLFYEIFQNQPTAAFPVLTVLAAFYTFYFWKRKSMLEKFERQKKDRKDEEKRVMQAIQRWLRLYYCPEDDIVFESGAMSAIPVDQMTYYLFQDE